MKDLLVKVSIRNLAMVKWRREEGLTQGQAAAAAGVSNQAWCSLETLRQSPMRRPDKKGEVHFRGIALAVSTLMNVPAHEIWTETVRGVVSNAIEFEAEASEIARVSMGEPASSPMARLEARDLNRAVNAVLKGLTPREEKVLLMRFSEDMSLDEVGAEMYISRERVRMIEAKALRKLRHPSMASRLREFAQ